MSLGSLFADDSVAARDASLGAPSNHPPKSRPKSLSQRRDAGDAAVVDQARSTVIASVGETAAFAALLLLIPIIGVIDARINGLSFSEYSLVEVSQEFAVALSSLLFLLAASKRVEMKSILILASGLFAVMFVRELDYLFDKLRHGAWVFPAVGITWLAIYHARRDTGNFFPSWAAYSRTGSYVWVSIGLIVLLVFSRLFGSGLIWDRLLATSPVESSYVKMVVQEGTELLGYSLILCGAIKLHRPESCHRRRV